MRLEGWPHGSVRQITDAEGGEFVRYQLEQLRALVAELVDRRNTISDLESGKSYPNWHTLSRLAYALEADLRFVGRHPVRVNEVLPRAGAGI